MCCDICPMYDECEKRNRLKENCCSRCPEYGYCNDEDWPDTGDSEENSF